MILNKLLCLFFWAGNRGVFLALGSLFESHCSHLNHHNSSLCREFCQVVGYNYRVGFEAGSMEMIYRLLDEMICQAAIGPYVLDPFGMFLFDGKLMESTAK